MTNKLRAAFYLHNKHINDVDLSTPELGNPGIGGTQYNFVALPYYFKKYADINIEPTIIANSVTYLPESIPNLQAEGLYEAAELAVQKGFDFFTFRHSQDEVGKKTLRFLSSANIHGIAWAHNSHLQVLQEIALNPQIKRLVCVSQEQLDLLRDHPVFKKSTVIFNLFDPAPYIPKLKPSLKKDKTVVYVGSLVPSKGFHVLAKVWAEVLKQCPEAKLKVIGSGKLYNRNSELGKWGLADEKYESAIRQYLAEDNGRPHPSVSFLGVLGPEKIEHMQQATLGVVNPTGNSENCPGSAIEFQACGTPVVSAARWGLLDTVSPNQTGLLTNSEKKLVEHIVYLLKNPDIAQQMGQKGISFVQNKFDPELIVKKWHQLFDDVINERPVAQEPINQYPFKHKKLLRELLRRSKNKYPVLSVIPPLVDMRRHLGLMFPESIKQIIKGSKRKKKNE